MVSVCMPGPAFSFLLYENAKSQFQQEGFLLGEVVHKEAITITDSDQQHVKISEIIKINSVMSCPHPYYFYNGTGKVDENKLREFLGDLFDKVVAWYCFERDPDFKLMLREKIVHKQLSNLFQGPPNLFLYCMLMSDNSHNGSTHAFSQTFLRQNNCTYENVPLHIPNLSEPNNCYVTPEPSSETFNKILREQKIELERTHNTIVINKILNALHEHTDSVIDEVVQAEKYIHELEEEIRKLGAKKKLKIERGENNIGFLNDRDLINTSLEKSGDEQLNSAICQQDNEICQENKDTPNKDEECQELLTEENENPSAHIEELTPSKDTPSDIKQRSPNTRVRGRGKNKASSPKLPGMRTRSSPKGDFKN